MFWPVGMLVQRDPNIPGLSQKSPGKGEAVVDARFEEYGACKLQVGSMPRYDESGDKLRLRKAQASSPDKVLRGWSWAHLLFLQRSHLESIPILSILWSLDVGKHTCI